MWGIYTISNIYKYHFSLIICMAEETSKQHNFFTHYFLAMIKPGDEQNHLFRQFLSSLSSSMVNSLESSIILDSFGCVGNLEQKIIGDHKRDKERTRHFYIISLPDIYGNLATSYFSTTPEAALIEITNQLRIIIDYHRVSRIFSKQLLVRYGYQGTIEQMLEMYAGLISQDVGKILFESISDSDKVRKFLTRRSFFFHSKVIMRPTNVHIGLETHDGKYLLRSHSSPKPYSGLISKLA